MRGGSQSQLMLCSDDELYVVKFQNNPQGVRILANELLATTLAERLGLPTAPVAIVSVSEDLIACSQEMVVERSSGRVPLRHGLCFGSRCQGRRDVGGGITFRAAHDCLPQRDLIRVENVSDFVGMLVFDKWTGNVDSRQAVFVQSGSWYRAVMIDHGSCFGGSRWDFFDCPPHGFYFPPVVYGDIRGFGTFEPWLDRLDREIDSNVLNEAAQQIPPEWYGADTSSLSRLVDRLDQRRKSVTIELWKAHRKFPQLFPRWIARSMHARASSG